MGVSSNPGIMAAVKTPGGCLTLVTQYLSAVLGTGVKYWNKLGVDFRAKEKINKCLFRPSSYLNRREST